MARLELKNVQKSYGATAVVHGVTVDIRDGEFVVMVGPSGCGKSTLLRMVAGLEDITGGEIRIGERVVNQVEPKDRDIAMVFQNYALYPHMSVYRNMAYGLTIAKTAPEEIARRVKVAADILELGALLERKPRDLSGGQRQRVAMGRAIVREPAVFLFDEPLSNLDAKLRVQMRLEIKKLHKRLGTTSLYVTHDQVEAMTLGERMIVMNAGRAEQIGTPSQVYATPASIFVASFIGSPPMNLVAGSITSEGMFSSRNGTSLGVAGRHPPVGQKVFLGVRPEHLVIGGGDWPFTVDLVEALGAELLVHGRIGDAPLVMRVNADQAIATDDKVSLGMRGDLHWFDEASGLRIALD
jgi:sn-glycerol 3-phosphate transport system ATP-binding protein